MNLVDLIKDQLGSEITNKLGSLAGSSDAQTKSAVAGGVPALLAALAGMASGSGGGADKLASVLGRLNPGSLGNLAGALNQQPGTTVEQGGNLLSSLFGEGTLSALIAAVSKFARLDGGTVKTLLAGLAPLVMGTVAGQFKGKPVTGAGLSNLFAEQKSNIVDALPAGLSLAGIPGLPQLGDAARNAAGTVQRTAQTAQSGASPLLKTLVPLALLAVVGFLAWQYFSARPEEVRAPKTVAQSEVVQEVKKPITALPVSMPDVSQFSKDLTGVYSNATDTLSKIKDADSAKAAVPELQKLRTKVDGMKAVWDKIPESARSTISATTSDHISKLRKMIEPLLAIPGVKNILQPILDEILPKLEAFKG